MPLLTPMPSSLTNSRLLWGLLLVAAGLFWPSLALAQNSMANPEAAAQMRREFDGRIEVLNRRIQQTQDDLQAMINDPRVPEETIRAKQRELSNLRAQRDEVATSYLIRMRRMQGAP